jgi:hypothetical protein
VVGLWNGWASSARSANHPNFRFRVKQEPTGGGDLRVEKDSTDGVISCGGFSAWNVGTPDWLLGGTTTSGTLQSGKLFHLGCI